VSYSSVENVTARHLPSTPQDATHPRLYNTNSTFNRCDISSQRSNNYKTWQIKAGGWGRYSIWYCFSLEPVV